MRCPKQPHPQPAHLHSEVPARWNGGQRNVLTPAPPSCAPRPSTPNEDPAPPGPHPSSSDIDTRSPHSACSRARSPACQPKCRTDTAGRWVEAAGLGCSMRHAGSAAGSQQAVVPSQQATAALAAAVAPAACCQLRHYRASILPTCRLQLMLPVLPQAHLCLPRIAPLPGRRPPPGPALPGCRPHPPPRRPGPAASHRAGRQGLGGAMSMRATAGGCRSTGWVGGRKPAGAASKQQPGAPGPASSRLDQRHSSGRAKLQYPAADVGRGVDLRGRARGRPVQQQAAAAGTARRCQRRHPPPAGPGSAPRPRPGLTASPRVPTRSRVYCSSYLQCRHRALGRQVQGSRRHDEHIAESC